MFNNKSKSYIVSAALIVAGISLSVQAKSIKDLTSKKSSKKLESQVQQVAALTGSALNVHSLGVGVGQTFLAGDFAKYGEDKITADLLYDYSASHSFNFMANLHYSSHKHKQTKTVVSGLALGVKAKLFNFDAFSPYASGGLGFYSPKLTRKSGDKYIDSESKITFGWHVGAGADLDLNNRVKVGAMFSIHNPFDVRQDNQSEVEGAYTKLLLTTYYKF